MDQPSIRSSHSKGSQCKLRRIDQTLQETTQRFVESLSKDIRISQHADPEYASKKLESDTWYWLTPVDNGRPGYLIFLPNQPAIWIDELLKHSYSIPIRVSPSIYQQKTVLIASLDRQDSLLRIEDAWLVAGEFLRSKSFSKRWEKVNTFFHSHFKSDPLLQQGLRIEMASHYPLAELSTLISSLNSPSCLFAQSEIASRRLRIPLTSPSERIPSRLPPQHSKIVSTPKSSPPLLPTPVAPLTSVASLTSVSPLTSQSIPSDYANLIPHDVFPDTYFIVIENVKKGYAAVQDLDLSLCLRKRVEQKLPLHAKVEWNSEFNMYEICSLLTEDK